MFRNQYDSDVTVWSPQGRLHQVEYAMEAVKLGSATVGLKNQTHAVLIALKRASSELSSHQKKIIQIDDHVGVSISGLTADARVLSRFMRMECFNYSFSHGKPIPLTRLITSLANKMQVCTQRYDRRPFGVGLIIAGYDSTGPHIYQSCPSANVFDCRAMAIGSRSQSARTYLEKHLSVIENGSTTELIKQGLRALRDTLPNESDLSTKNVAIGLVGKGTPLYEFSEQETQTYLTMIEGEERRGAGTTPAAPTAEQPAASAPVEGVAGSSEGGGGDPAGDTRMETE